MIGFFILLYSSVHAAEFRTHSLLGGIRLDSTDSAVGGGAQLQYRWHHSPSLSVDASGGIGYLNQAKTSWEEDHSSLLLTIGPSWHVHRSQQIDVYLGLRFLHLHHATLNSWLQTPVANMIGDSAGGVLHRSGLGTTLGLNRVLLTLPTRHIIMWENEISLQWIPSSAEYHVLGEFSTGLRWGIAD